MNYVGHALSALSFEDLGIIGSAIPDIRYYNLNYLHRPKNCTAFVEFVEENFPEYANFAYGVLNHQILDRLLNKEGSYFRRTREEVADFLRERKVSALYADLVLDMAVDANLIRDNISIAEKTKAAWDNTDIGAIAGIMAEFFKKDKEEVYRALSIYRGILPRFFDAYKTPEGCAEAAAMRINRLKAARNNKKEVKAGDFQDAFGHITPMIFISYYREFWNLVAEAKKAEDLLTAR